VITSILWAIFIFVVGIGLFNLYDYLREARWELRNKCEDDQRAEQQHALEYVLLPEDKEWVERQKELYNEDRVKNKVVPHISDEAKSISRDSMAMARTLGKAVKELKNEIEAARAKALGQTQETESEWAVSLEKVIENEDKSRQEADEYLNAQLAYRQLQQPRKRIGE
jgi:hypothetical protein